ncbi:MAG TPA: isoprenylcysteine carboxylmethyltransferase family protein [Streptosporangiaceae bacterium]|nr:isoprenylcysteine carboxylmethyltransferase family protein [Streptosporangiaceae bacterium]
MLEWLPAGPVHGPAVITLLSWGAAELALRLRLAIRPGWRARLSTWSAAAGGRLREWTFFVVVLAIGAAVIGALWLDRLRQFAIGGGRLTIVAGEVLAVAGIALRMWAILTLDKFFTFVVGIAADHRVVQHGPYRLLRHPGYAGALLTLLGIGIALGNWLSLLLIVAVPVLALGIRITVEEATLAGALGAEYLSYADRTARLIPGLW